MFITKADGTQEPFNVRKLEQSLKRAGASKQHTADIVVAVEAMLTPGMRTQDIYRKAFELLRTVDDPVAAKYSIRRAVFSLGPTGFPFEDFLGKLFEAQGYRTKRRLLIRGQCVTHEIDLAAYSPGHSFVAEAKFHAQPGIKSDLQVAMYSYARFLDLRDARICKGDECGIVSLSVITNTKFTDAAIKYATCTGINLLSWDYPRGASLHDMIERYRTYPITVLTKLSQGQKQSLLERGTILCTDILTQPSVLHEVGLKNQRADAVIGEAELLCETHRTL